MMPLNMDDCKKERDLYPEGSGQRRLRNEPPRALPVVMTNPFCSELGAEKVCCLPSDTVQLPKLAHPCTICGANPSSIVEVPCGHVSTCVACFGCYRHNERCLRCKQKVQGRVDVLPFLDPHTGEPRRCHMCMDAVASVVTVPCAHMCFCERCLPGNIAGCPQCGQRVERVYYVQWQRNVAVPNFGGLETATEDIDVEIERLERQLTQLKRLSHEDGPRRGLGGTSSSIGREARDKTDSHDRSANSRDWNGTGEHHQDDEKSRDEPGCW